MLSSSGVRDCKHGQDTGTGDRGATELERSVDRLLSLETWAVVGLSDNRARAAWDVALFLQRKGKRIVPVHPRAQTVHGEPGYASVADIPFPVDVVDCFVRSELVAPVVDEAVAAGAQGVWMQLGVLDLPAAGRAEAAGLTVVMDRCPKIEWRD
jgi:predicted CoA-binding protein